MFEELTIKNNEDGTYSLFVKNCMNSIDGKIYDVEAKCLNDIVFGMDGPSYPGDQMDKKMWIRANLLEDYESKLWKLILKVERVSDYNKVIEHLKNGRELIFTSAKGTQQRFREWHGNLQDFKNGKWEDRAYLPNWSDLSAGEWSVVL